jgi:hypothetical protein
MPELSVVVLAYRAEHRTGDVVLPLYDLLEAEGVSYELIIVANYWSRDDSTPAVAADLARGRQRSPSSHGPSAVTWAGTSALGCALPLDASSWSSTVTARFRCNTRSARTGS